MEKNVMEELMENYRKELEEIDKKYDVAEPETKDTKELDEKIEYQKNLIEKLKFESKDLNAEMISDAEEKMQKMIDEKQSIEEENRNSQEQYENQVKDKNQLRNSTVVLDSGREVTMKEKDEMDKKELREKTLRQFKTWSKTISERISQEKENLEAKREEWNNFKYEYEKDDIGNSTGKATNEEDIKQIHEDYDQIKEKLVLLNELQEDCNKYIEELNAEMTQEVEKYSKAWNEAYRDEYGKQKENLNEEAEKQEDLNEETEKQETTLENENDNKEENEEEKAEEVATEVKMEETEKPASNLENELNIANFSEKEPVKKSADIKFNPISKDKNVPVKSVNVEISQNGIPTYTFKYEDGSEKSVTIMTDNMSKNKYNSTHFHASNYRKMKKEISSYYNINKDAMKKIDPFLIQGLNYRKNDANVLIDLINDNKEITDISINYDMKNLQELPLMYRNTFRKIARNAEKIDGIQVENFKDTLFHRMLNKIKAMSGKLLKGKEKTEQLTDGTKVESTKPRDEFMEKYKSVLDKKEAKEAQKAENEIETNYNLSEQIKGVKEEKEKATENEEKDTENVR